MPRSRSVRRTASLLVICSREMAGSVVIWCWRALKIVISAAKSLAFKMMVGAKSAKGRLSGTFHCAFMACVDCPNRAWSPLLRMRAKSWFPPVCSKITRESSFSVVVSFLRRDALCLQQPLLDQFRPASLDGEIGLGESNFLLLGVAILGDEVAGVAGEHDVVDFTLSAHRRSIILLTSTK